MSRAESLLDRYKTARLRHEVEPAEVRTDAVFAAGVLLGADLPGAAAAIEYMFRQLWPDHDFPIIGDD